VNDFAMTSGGALHGAGEWSGVPEPHPHQGSLPVAVGFVQILWVYAMVAMYNAFWSAFKVLFPINFHEMLASVMGNNYFKSSLTTVVNYFKK